MGVSTVWRKVKPVLSWIWAPPPLRPNLWARWGWRAAVAIVLLIVAVPVIIVPVIEGIICGKLEALVAQQTNATLEIGSFHYAAPLGAVIDGIQLVGPGPDGKPMTLVDVPELKASLASLPHGSVDIALAELDNPVIHAVRLPSGKLWTPQFADLMKPSPAPPTPAQSGSAGTTVQVRKFSVNNATLVIDDAQAGDSQAAALTMSVGPLSLQNQVVTFSDFELATQLNEAIDGVKGNLKVSGSGSMPLQNQRDAKMDMTIGLDGSAAHNGVANAIDMTMSTHATMQNQVVSFSDLDLASQLNAPVDGASGQVKISGSGSVPLQNWRNLQTNLTLGLNGSGVEDGIPSKLNAAMIVHTSDQKGTLTLEHFLAATGGSGGASFAVNNQPAISADLANGTWSAAKLVARMKPATDRAQLPPSIARVLNELGLEGGAFSLTAQASGKLPSKPITSLKQCLNLINPGTVATIVPDQLTLQPGDLTHHIVVSSQSPMAVVFDRDGLKIHNIHADYGSDRLAVNSMEVPLVDLLHGVFAVENLAAKLTLDPFAPDYPPFLQQIFFNSTPQGTVEFGSDEMQLAGSHVTGDFHIQIANGTVRIAEIDAELPHGNEPLSGTCQVSLNKFNLQQLRQIVHFPDPQGRIGGEVSGDIYVQYVPIKPGQPAIDAIMARGTLQVDDGDFFDIPAFGQIAQITGVNVEQAGRVGQTAAIFTIKDGILHFDKLAVNSPALGIAGSGDVNLVNQTLNLTLVAQALGDWKSKASGIPVLSNVLGVVQNGLNQFSASNLYNFTVSGPFANPAVQAHVLPGLSQAQQGLFGTMQNLGSRGGDLLNQLKGQQSQGK